VRVLRVKVHFFMEQSALRWSKGKRFGGLRKQFQSGRLPSPLGANLSNSCLAFRFFQAEFVSSSSVYSFDSSSLLVFFVFFAPVLVPFSSLFFFFFFVSRGFAEFEESEKLRRGRRKRWVVVVVVIVVVVVFGGSFENVGEEERRGLFLRDEVFSFSSLMMMMLFFFFFVFFFVSFERGRSSCRHRRCCRYRPRRLRHPLPPVSKPAQSLSISLPLLVFHELAERIQISQYLRQLSGHLRLTFLHV
jgi:hypothetical protein